MLQGYLSHLLLDELLQEQLFSANQLLSLAMH